MAPELAGRLDRRARWRGKNRGVGGKFPGGDRPGAQEAKGAVPRGDDSGFHAKGAWSTVKDEGNASVEFLDDVRGGGGGDTPEAVGAGRGDRFAKPAEDGPEKRMRTHSDSDGVEPRCDNIGDDGTAGQDQRERPGPVLADEGLDQGIAGGVGEPVEPIEGRKVDDERIEVRALFGLEDAGRGLGIEGMPGQPVNGLSGKGDNLAGGEEFRGPLNAGHTLEKLGIQLPGRNRRVIPIPASR